MMMDPLVGAVCTPPEIAQMVDDLLIAQADWLPQYGTAIDAARERVRSGRACRPVSGKGPRGCRSAASRSSVRKTPPRRSRPRKRR